MNLSKWWGPCSWRTLDYAQMEEPEEELQWENDGSAGCHRHAHSVSKK